MKNEVQSLLTEGILRVDEEVPNACCGVSMSELFRTYESSNVLVRLMSGGLLKELGENAPNCIVLYRSGRDGKVEQKRCIGSSMRGKRRQTQSGKRGSGTHYRR